MKKMNIALTLLCAYVGIITNMCTAKSIEECGRKTEDFRTIQVTNKTGDDIEVTISQDISLNETVCMYTQKYSLQNDESKPIYIDTGKAVVPQTVGQLSKNTVEKDYITVKVHNPKDPHNIWKNFSTHFTGMKPRANGITIIQTTEKIPETKQPYNKYSVTFDEA